ncbi:MAG TPA: PfkB family carbohydrate kinase [Thermoplasmata archaeon]|nr:PfkB family carbohydrate kinase [Thermoplasmata archaeon]
MDDPLRNRPRDLLVAGHVNVDEFLRVADFPREDRTVPVVDRRSELGGTATNIVFTASRYGVVCGLVARLGAGFPPVFRERLQEGRIDVRGVETFPRRTTPTCYIIEDRRGGQRTLIDQGAMADDAPHRFRVGPWLSEYSWLHLTTGPPTALLWLQGAARRAGLHLAADPGQEIHYRWEPPHLRRLLASSEILWGNRSEIDRALSLLKAAGPEALLEKVPLVVRTEGAGGATAFSRAGTIHVRAGRPRKVRTAVGAGDAFRGGFYAAWFAGQRLRECLTAGGRAAARWMEGAR